jgi:hypothetical protein
MNLKGNIFCIVTVYPSICLEGLSKSVKKLVTRAIVLVEIQIGYLPGRSTVC